MKKQKGAIVGLGKMGISHAAIVGAHPDVQLTAVCDTSSIILEAFKKYTNKKIYSNFKKMLQEESLDFVIIATPTKLHYPMVLEAFDHNLNVFCEKPLSLIVEEAEFLCKRANQLRLVNQVGYHNRFLATFNEVKRILSLNIIGELYHFKGESYGPVVLKEKSSTWRSERAEGGGCLYDYASHTIDLINFLLGRPVKVAGTKLKSIFSNSVEDAVYSTLTLESGLSGQLSVNWSDETHRKMSTQISILGKKGRIVADATEVKIYLNESNKALGLSKGWTIEDIISLTKNVNYYLRGEEYSSQIDYFINCIQTKKTDNRNSFESASQTDEVIGLLLKDNTLN